MKVICMYEDFKTIPLTKGLTAMVSSEDYEKVSAYKWHANGNRRNGKWYAETVVKAGNRYRDIKMHRLILDAPDGIQVDHANGNGLDNRRTNIRLATRQQNQQNRPKQSTRCGRKPTSIYKGVYRDWNIEKWVAQITRPDKKRITLGSFVNEIEAAKFYDQAALYFHKEFASTNFPCELDLDFDPYSKLQKPKFGCVTYVNKTGKWMAARHINKGASRVSLGCYATEAEAREVLAKAEAEATI